MELGILSLVDHHPGPLSQADRLRQVVEQAVLAEELGFDTFWVGEHHFMDYICPTPALLLAAIAERTSRIRLGTGVALAPHHDPVRMAEDYAMLDNLAGGRFDLVVSRGTFKGGFDGFNQDMRERGARAHEAVEIIRGCWTSERFSYDGRFRVCRDLYVQPRPLQDPHPPMWFGAASEISARFAADAGLHLSVPDFLGPGVDVGALVRVYREQLAAAGRDPSAFRVSVGKHVFIGDTVEDAVAMCVPAYRSYTGMMVRQVQRSAVPDDPIAEALATLAEVPDELLSAGALCGDASVVAQEICRLRDELEIDHYWAMVDLGAQPFDQVEASLRRLAADVLPRVRTAPVGVR